MHTAKPGFYKKGPFKGVEGATLPHCALPVLSHLAPRRGQKAMRPRPGPKDKSH